MKAILEFDLEEIGDREEHLRCVKSLDLALALWDITSNNKRLDREGILDKMESVLNEYDINLDILVT